MRPTVPFKKFGDSIFYGFIFFNAWVSLIFSKIPSLLPFDGLPEQKTVGYTLAIGLMIMEFFIFFSRDQWKDIIRNFESMDRKVRVKQCWRLIIFLIVVVPATLTLFYMY